MKIIKLKSENVKRLSAVEIAPGDASLVVVGGKNGAGKSSVLDSIAYALGGQQLVPAEPIRSGESEARITIDLGDLVVTRRFRRERIDAPKPEGATDFTENVKWGDTTSTLVVTNRDGAKYPSPQAVLDKLLGELTFDPLAFARETPKRQDAILRELVGIDTTPLDNRRKELVAQRTMAKRTTEARAAVLQTTPLYEKAPAAEIPLDEISREMLQAEEYRKLAEDAERDVEKATTLVYAHASRRDVVNVECNNIQKEIDKLFEQLKSKQDELKRVIDAQEDAKRDVDAKQITAQAARAVVPDVSKLRDKLKHVEQTNAEVRANAKYYAVVEDVQNASRQHDALDAEIDKLDAQKESLLANAKLPVEQLAISDAGVTFGGVPFEQASTSEQLRASVAIGLALNPQLRVLLVRNGNALDDEHVKLLAEMAESAGAQVWMEYVSADGDGVSVMIEDGRVAVATTA